MARALAPADPPRAILGRDARRPSRPIDAASAAPRARDEHGVSARTVAEGLDGVGRAGVAIALGRRRELADGARLVSLRGRDRAAPLFPRAALDHVPERLPGAR